MTSVPDAVVFDNPEKLKSVLARRGLTWGFAGPITLEQIRDFQQVLTAHVSAATEVWQAPYRGSDRLFYLKEDRVVVVHLDGVFESAWRATPAQITHYRTGVKIK